MKIGLGQINMHLGDVEHNTNKVLDTIQNVGEDCDVLVFPELTLPGSPGNDLYESNELITQQKQALQKIHTAVQHSKNDLTVILGYIQTDPNKQQPGGGIRKYNAAAAISKTGIRTTYKQNLCDYDVFYESRQMHPGRKVENIAIDSDIPNSTITICEDLFNPLHDYQPLHHRSMDGIEYIFNLSSSPFALGKLERRIDTMKEHAKTWDANVIYLNQVGAQDDNIFDGGSFIIDKAGNLIDLAKQFAEDVHIVEIPDVADGTTRGDSPSIDLTDQAIEHSRDKYTQIDQAISLGIQDYFEKSGLQKAVIGISGGIDSTISLFYAVQVLGAENVTAVYMPSKHSTNSKTDAHQLAKNLGVTLQEREIQSRFDAIQQRHAKEYGQPLEHDNPAEKIAYENIQARIRGQILMEISNLTPRSTILNNSNKTEMLMGYGTLHGDMIGVFNMIGDLNKKEVYELAQHINKTYSNPIPKHIITKPASAELNVEQVDPFDYFRVSEAIDELGNGASPDDVIEKYDLTLEEAQEYARKIRMTEFKRREFYPIILRLKQRNMGIGRRYPVVRGM